MTKLILSFIFLLSTFYSLAQESTAAPQMADTLRSEGKIYVVVTVIGMIFLALVVFLVILERKLNRIEKQVNKK